MMTLSKTNSLLAFGSLFLLVFVVFIGYPMNVSADPTTIYVDDVPGSGTDNPAEDYTSIQAAINAASAGDTIYIYSGTYTEQLTVTKALTLEGENKDTTIVKAPAGWYTIGINAYSVTGITIKDLNVQGFFYGIYVRYSSACTITDNIVAGNSYGILIYGTPSSTITNNTVLGPGDYGIRLYYSPSCTMMNNSMANNKYNFYLDAHSLGDYYQNIDPTNTVNGRSIYYLIGISDVEFNSENSYKDAGLIAVIDSDNITIKDLTFSNNSHGVLLLNTPNPVIENVEVSNTYYGFYLYSSASAIFNNNTVTSSNYGIYLKESCSSKLTYNTVSDSNYGIYLYYCESSTLTDNIVTGNTFGVHLLHSGSSNLTENTAIGNNVGFQVNISPSCIVTGNTANDNTDSGIFVMDFSYHTKVINNTIAGNNKGVYVRSISFVTVAGNAISGNTNYGIYVYISSSCTFTENTFKDNHMGFVIDQAPSCTLKYNRINTSVYNFGVTGYSLSDYIQNIDSTNTINGKPIYYLQGVSDVVISPKSEYKDAGYLGFIDSERITIRDMSISSNLQGVLLYGTTDSVIQDVILSNNQYGINMNSCDFNTVTGNTAQNNDWYGIHMQYCNSNNVTDNTITGSGRSGMMMLSCFSNLISGNNLIDNARGLFSQSSASNKLIMNKIAGSTSVYGLYMAYSDSWIVKANTITGYTYGIYLMRSSSFSITCNRVANNVYGFFVYYMANNNIIFHNNVVDNTYQVYNLYSTNTWDDGYPSGGNYFSDYSGSDANSDGIGDTPYVIDTSNQDNYPLMSAWGPEDSIDELFEDIGSMGLHSGLEDSLETKLNDILDSIADEEYNDASNQLEAFINQVEAQRGKKLSEGQADQLIESAEIIIYMISNWI